MKHLEQCSSQENETPFQELGQTVEWRKDDGFSLDQRRNKSGAEGSAGSNSGGKKIFKIVVSSPPSIGSLPHQSHAARFGSVGGEGVGGGGVGVGLEDEVAEEVFRLGPRFGKAPETTRGRGKREEPSNQGPTHPRSRKRRLRDSPEGRGAGDRELHNATTTPAPSLSSPQRPEGEVSRARGVTVASRPGGPLPLPAWGPEGLSLQGRGEGGEKRGRWRANPEPPGPPPAPSPGPSAPPAHMPAPRKLSQGRAQLGAAAVRPPAPRPHRGPACSARARRPPRPPQLFPVRPRRANAPSQDSPSRLSPSPPEGTGASVLANPAPSGRAGGRQVPRAGAAPAPPASPPRLGSHLSPAPRAAASARLALRDSSPELSQSAGAPPFSPRDSASPRRFPPSPPPKPQLPSFAAPPGCNSRFPHTPAAVPAHKNSPFRGARFCRARRRKGSRSRGWGRGAPRPPPASRPPSRPPGKARLPARVGHAVRCRLPSALTFAAEAVAEAAAAMFPC
ncbi:basic proline-rich protein-like [Panthera uncia]|uniref:basic proline-rich protein-like n=1 Tax=Panthera uncia TaxID=29064 RepID=UPI0020FF995B|nr:basic proline-rich protein-like [Panthera uncia]